MSGTKYYIKQTIFMQAVIAFMFMCIWGVAKFFDPIPLWGLPLVMGLVFIVQLFAKLIVPLEEWWMGDGV